MKMRDNHDHPPKRGVALQANSVIEGADAALGRIRRDSGAVLAFCGRVDEDGVILDRFDGPIVGPLRGVRLSLGHGLGGRVARQQRAIATSDYMASPVITHQYDEIIKAESLRAMAAAPVVVARRPIAVLYVALRTSQQQMGRLLDIVTQEARSIEQQVVLTQLTRQPAEHANDPEPRRRARVAESHARLRALASELDHPEQRARLLEAADLLLDATSEHADVPHLSHRERDVLALMAAGLSNRDIADRLGIGVHTTKDHVGSLLAKFGARRRLEAVITARSLGLAP